MSHVPSLRDIKCIQAARISTIPKQQRSRYLNLYVLLGDKKRLEKELFRLQQDMKPVKKRLIEINKHKEKLIKEINRSASAERKRPKPGKKLMPQKIKIRY